ncbi:MAG: SWIM zinc finger family protein [Carbonactinosporaceae bacterium]
MAPFTDADLRVLAGPRSYARGEAYVDAVSDMEEIPGGVVATVHGGDAYSVALIVRDGELAGDCDCPYGSEGAFCKHCVATGLVVLARDDGTHPPQPAGADQKGRVDLRAYLGALDSATLARLLYEHARDDPDLHRRLVLRAARTDDSGPDVATIRRQLDTALRPRGFLGYRNSFDYARRANDTLDTLGELVDTGYAAAAVPLTRRAVERIAAALEQMDDSSGVAGDACHRALELYAAACSQAPPDPDELAEWLVNHEVAGPGWPEIELAAFAEALGERGLAAYRARVEDVWARLPPPAPDDLKRLDEHVMKRLTLQRMREKLAELEGDVDAFVAVLAESLPRPDTYLRIAEVLRDAGRAGEAISWAEHGLSDNAGYHATRLTGFLVAAYVESGRGKEALDLRREGFERAPRQATYEQLKVIAEELGCWPEFREWALETLRARADDSLGVADELVRVLMAEHELEQAWAAACDHGCGDETWLTLAESRGQSHPADVIPVYARLVEVRAALANQQGYRQAVRLLSRMRDAYLRTGDDSAFSAYVVALRQRHRRKRSLLAELDRRGF